MTMLSSSSPVAATSRSGGRLMPARSSTYSSVASPRSTWCSNSASSLSKRYGCCSISVTSWPARSSDRVRFAPTLPPPAIRTYIRRATSPARTALTSVSIARRGRADDVQAALGVELGAAPDRARGRSRSAPRTASTAAWAITRFVLSPSVVTTTASASSMPASRSSVRSMPCPTRKPPVQCSPSRARASSFSSSAVTSQPEPCSCERDSGAHPAAADHDRFHSGASVAR